MYSVWRSIALLAMGLGSGVAAPDSTDLLSTELLDLQEKRDNDNYNLRRATPESRPVFRLGSGAGGSLSSSSR